MREIDCGAGRRGLVFESFAGQPRLRHVCTTRSSGGGGNLSLSGGRARDAALAERAFWCRALGADPAALVVGGQVHGAKVARVDAADRGRGALDPAGVLPARDALVCSVAGLPLLSASADCAPVLLHVEGVAEAFAVAHAGWRGLQAGVLRAAARALAEAAGAAPAAIRAGVGPCIGPPHYEVGAEVLEVAPAAARVRVDSSWQLDLAVWAHCELVAAGLAGDRIELSGCNTAADARRFFSHRRDGAATGRTALIALLACPESEIRRQSRCDRGRPARRADEGVSVAPSRRQQRSRRP